MGEFLNQPIRDESRRERYSLSSAFGLTSIRSAEDDADMRIFPVRRARSALFTLAAVVLGLIVLETGFRVAQVARDYRAWIGGAPRAQKASERAFCRYDPVLGWRNIPGARVADAFGDGVGVAINGQGFRAAGEADAAVPPGKNRLICLGDSFTFGHGVSAEESWPAQLAAMNPTLDVLNWGTNGYGLDQMFLLYRMNGDRFAHQAVLLALIADDLTRTDMAYWTNGFFRPRVNFDPRTHWISNDPIPRPVRQGGPIVTRRQRLLFLLGSSEMFRALRSWIGSAPSPQQKEELAARCEHLMDALDAAARERGAKLAVFLLPVSETTAGVRWEDEVFRDLLRALAAKPYPVQNLTRPVRDRAARDGRPLERGSGDPHYSAYGNRVLAETIAGMLPALLPATAP